MNTKVIVIITHEVQGYEAILTEAHVNSRKIHLMSSLCDHIEEALHLLLELTALKVSESLRSRRRRDGTLYDW